MTWAQLHQASERAAIDAEAILRQGDAAAAARVYAKAAALECRALAALDIKKARTRGITAVSAVSLRYKAHEFDAAQQLAGEMLVDSSIPHFAKIDIRDLLNAIHAERLKFCAAL